MNIGTDTLSSSEDPWWKHVDFELPNWETPPDICSASVDKMPSWKKCPILFSIYVGFGIQSNSQSLQQTGCSVGLSDSFKHFHKLNLLACDDSSYFGQKISTCYLDVSHLQLKMFVRDEALFKIYVEYGCGLEGQSFGLLFLFSLAVVISQS